MSNRKSKAARKQGRSREISPDPSNELKPRLKAIGLRALMFAIFLTISGFAMSAYWNYAHPAKPLHQFSASERSVFINALKAAGVPVQSVWLACPEGKTETCELVKQFITMFQESGWKVEGNQVIAWKPAHPLGGVHLILHTAGGPDDTTPAQSSGMKNSFAAIGIPVQTAGAPDVPKNSIGVFFGPDL